MGTLTCTKVLQFSAGHRVLEHGGRCRFLHGHGYSVEVHCSAQQLDKLGMVIDFGVIKSVFGKWLDNNLDHNMLLHMDDPQLLHFCKTEERKPYVLHDGGNPTAENIAADLQYRASELLAPYGIKVVRMVVWETPSCFATYQEE